jgi:hypothetical protein
MEVFMNRFIGSTLTSAAVVALALGATGCQGGGTDPGSKDEGIKKAKEAGEKTKQVLEKMQQQRGGAAPGGAADDDDKDKGKDKSGDKE